MHYTVLVFSVPTYVSAFPVPSSGVPSRVHNPQCIQFTQPQHNQAVHNTRTPQDGQQHSIRTRSNIDRTTNIHSQLPKTILTAFSILYYDYRQIKILKIHF
jgi:hypothetical protein